MKRIAHWYDNKVIGVPSKGCQLCAKGAKLVLFITGECESNCYYCPIAKERRKDVIFANEQEINQPLEAITEAKMISALGVGITVGEPLVSLDRVISYLAVLKEEFGKEFHCHLYTSYALDDEQLARLHQANLDEIRFHPPRLKLTEAMRKSITKAKQYDWSVGIEIPVIPDKSNLVDKIIEYSINENLEFVNLNELEITESNFTALNKLGYKVKSNTSAAVKQSENVAINLLKKYKQAPITIHYCSSKYKDRVQLRNRLIRRAEKFSKPFDKITEEGLIVRSRISLTSEIATKELALYIVNEFNIKENMIEVNNKEKIIFTGEEIISEIWKSVISKFEKEILSIEIIHQYPYAKGIITYLDPIFNKK
jgi:pyruvate formate-lyase activating enzyme-like uncharacterized protein